MLSPDVMRRAQQEVGRRMVEMNLRRLDAMRNRDGSRMPGLSPGYKRFKIGRGLKGVRDTKLSGKLRKTIRAIPGTPTQHGGEISLPVAIDVTAAAKLGQLEGLSTGRFGKRGRGPAIDVLGIYNAGTAEGKRERRELVQAAADVMRIAGKGKIIDT
jgi:hypothetical protein